jgi:hypothetical protein
MSQSRPEKPRPPKRLFKSRFRERRAASARLESVESVAFRQAMYAENAAEFEKARAASEVERIVADALGKPPHGIEASVFILQQITGERPWKCLGCHSASSNHVVAWRPSEPYLRRLFGLPSGHIAAVLYPICEGCALRESDPEWLKALEDQIIADLREQQLIPAEAS